MFKRRLETHLLKWKNSPTRKPLIIRGARQVGKTKMVQNFAKEHFTNLVYLNLENPEHAQIFNEPISVTNFNQIIEAKFNTSLNDSKNTLLFIDEVQQSENAVKLLRFLYEETPQTYVITAGSLLEAKIKDFSVSFPVGRVENAYLYPLDFFEFLNAIGEFGLEDYLVKVSLKDEISPSIHQHALNMFKQYALVGGMPEAVLRYAINKSIAGVKDVYSDLLTAYNDDIYKYSTKASQTYVSHVLQNAPLFAGTLFKYENFADSAYKSREMHEAFTLLESVMLIKQLPATDSTQLPIVAKTKRPKKLIFLDVGFVNYKSDLYEKFFTASDLQDVFRGRVAEQIIGQNLISLSETHASELYYWAKPKAESSAEVDFCILANGLPVGIEVKSGSLGRLKSLQIFGKEVANAKLVRFYSGEKVFEDGVLSLPFYLVPRFYDFVRG